MENKVFEFSLLYIYIPEITPDTFLRTEVFFSVLPPPTTAVSSLKVDRSLREAKGNRLLHSSRYTWSTPSTRLPLLLHTPFRIGTDRCRWNWKCLLWTEGASLTPFLAHRQTGKAAWLQFNDERLSDRFTAPWRIMVNISYTCRIPLNPLTHIARGL